MHKWEVKRILNTMRTPYNEKEVNLVLARVDMTPDFRLEKLIAEFGDDKNAVIQYFQENIDQMCDKNDDKVEAFNDNKYVKSCVMRESFIMGVDTRRVIDQKSFEGIDDEILLAAMMDSAMKGRRDVATLHMFDAMEQLMEKINAGDREVANIKDIQVFYDGELDMPEEFCESSNSIDQATLLDSKKLEEDSNLRKAVQIFGTDTPLRSITISIDTFKSKEFGEMMTRRLKEYQENGILVEPAEEVKEDVTQGTPSKSAPENDDREQ